jgi:hypothetical protein
MKRILLFAISTCLALVGCSGGGGETPPIAGSVQKAIDAISDKSSVKSLVVNGDLTSEDWLLLKEIRVHLPAIENITLNDVVVVKRDIFAYKDGMTWITNRWLKTFSAPQATTIEDLAFTYCEGLTSFSAPQVKKIGYMAFADCGEITSFDFPKTKEAGEQAFYGCEKLTIISIPELSELKDELFHSCRSMTSIDLPKVVKINHQIFRNCDNLTQIKLGTTAKIDATAISFELVDTKAITLDIVGVNAEDAVGRVWKDCVWKNITNSGQALPLPDFGVANWGSTIDFVRKYDTGTPISGGNLIRADKYGKWYIYLFDNNEKLIGGKTDESIQFGGDNPWLIFSPIIAYQSTLTELSARYGEPINRTEDVFSYNMDDMTYQPGYAFYEAQVIMGGGKSVTYTFGNNRTSVESVLRFYTRKGMYQPYGYTISTVYAKK